MLLFTPTRYIKHNKYQRKTNRFVVLYEKKKYQKTRSNRLTVKKKLIIRTVNKLNGNER